MQLNDKAPVGLIPSTRFPKKENKESELYNFQGFVVVVVTITNLFFLLIYKSTLFIIKIVSELNENNPNPILQRQPLLVVCSITFMDILCTNGHLYRGTSFVVETKSIL